MWGIAGHSHAPGQPALDGFDAANRQREREAKQNAKGKAGGKRFTGKGSEARAQRDAKKYKEIRYA